MTTVPSPLYRAHMRPVSPTPPRSAIACPRRVIALSDANPAAPDAEGSYQGKGGKLRLSPLLGLTRFPRV